MTETDLSDYYSKLISTFFKARSSRIRPKTKYYGNCKNFKGLLPLKLFSFSTVDRNQNQDILTENLLSVVNKNTPLKRKLIRGNQTPFMNRNFKTNLY